MMLTHCGHQEDDARVRQIPREVFPVGVGGGSAGERAARLVSHRTRRGRRDALLTGPNRGLLRAAKYADFSPTCCQLARGDKAYYAKQVFYVRGRMAEILTWGCRIAMKK